jgi:hypothetical protein
MKAFFVKAVLGCALLLASLVSGSRVANAAPCASPAAKAANCALDQQMWINGGGDGFGGGVVLGQTFVPSAPGRLCKVEVMILKNQPGALNLSIVHPNFVQVASMTKNNIPPGGPQMVTFEFGCANGPVLQGSPFYGLILKAQAAEQFPTYSWINSDDAGADAAYPPGHGWYNAAGGAPGAWVQLEYDYAFRVYMCR